MKFDETKLRADWHRASKQQRKLAMEEAVEFEKRRVSMIDLSYRKAAVFLTGGALLSAGIASLRDTLQLLWPSATAAMIAIVATVLVIVPKFRTVRISRSTGPEKILSTSPAEAEENKFIRHRRHTFNLERDIYLKRLYMSIAGLALIVGVLSLFLAL